MHENMCHYWPAGLRSNACSGWDAEQSGALARRSAGDSNDIEHLHPAPFHTERIGQLSDRVVPGAATTGTAPAHC